MKLKQFLKEANEVKSKTLYDILKRLPETTTLNVEDMKKAVDFNKILKELVYKAMKYSKEHNTGTIHPVHHAEGTKPDFAKGIQNYGKDIVLMFNIEHKDRRGHNYTKAVQITFEELKELK